MYPSAVCRSHSGFRLTSNFDFGHKIGDQSIDFCTSVRILSHLQKCLFACEVPFQKLLIPRVTKDSKFMKLEHVCLLGFACNLFCNCL